MSNNQQPLSFFQRVVQDDKPVDISPRFYMDISQNANVCTDAMSTKINEIDSIPDYELFNLIKASFDIICQDIMDNGSKSAYVPALNNEKFITSFSRVLGTIPIQYKHRVCCSKLTYDYIVVNSVPRADLSDSEKKKIELKKSLFRNISKIVNRNSINQLINLGLSESDAANICTARYSSMKEDICAKRMNFTLCTKDPNVMTEQTIVNIYEKLFDHVTDLFIGTMFDENEYEAEERDGENGAEEFSEVYSAISLAILVILNNMPLSDIYTIISTFCKQYKYYRGIGKYQPVRFNLRAISGDYYRVLQVIEKLEMEGWDIPV